MGVGPSFLRSLSIISQHAIGQNVLKSKEQEKSVALKESFHKSLTTVRYTEKTKSLNVWGGVSMNSEPRNRSRWVTALTVTWLTGAALSGCTRGTRDVTADLKESAAREAFEAERDVAERKRASSPSQSKSRELATNDIKSKSVRTGVGSGADARSTGLPKTFRNKDFDFEETNTDSAELALRASMKPRVSKAASTKQTRKTDQSLETAEWAVDEFDQSVRTVSDEEELPVAESLLDRPADQAIAEDLFPRRESEAGKRVIRSKSTPAGQKLSQAQGTAGADRKSSDDETSTHPWASKSPQVQARKKQSDQDSFDPSSSDMAGELESDPSAERREEREARLVQRPMPGPKSYLETDESTSDSASLKLERKRRLQQDIELDPEKIEAQARVRALLSQARSFVQRQDFRSAYRVAQTAQRIADSENLFFSGGEEQPSDVVRSILMKIRFEEQKLASRNSVELTPEEVAEEAIAEDDSIPAIERDWTQSGNDQDQSVAASDKAASSSNKTPGWGDAEWQLARETGSSPEPVDPSSPWEKSSVSSKSAHKTSQWKSPHSTSSVFPEVNSDFPESMLEWKGIASIGHDRDTLSQTEDRPAPGMESAASEVVQTALASSRNQTDYAPRHEQSPISFSPHPEADPTSFTPEGIGHTQAANTPSIAQGGDLRSQSLSDPATNRAPLLVAPVPPVAPLAPEPNSSPTVDLLGIDVEEPPVPAPDHKLWMFLSAAAGAFAMLFVRRRPSVVSRQRTSES